jgi:Hsp20/alpha crystallin family
MRALAPWRGMDALREDMERVFDRFFEPRRDEFAAAGAWAPKHRVERSWGDFVRTITLPAGVETEKVNAIFKDGVLTVKLPKTPAAKGTAIPVKAA